MRKDILFPQVKGIQVAITRKEDDNFWEVYLLNDSDTDLNNVIIVSKGYTPSDTKEEEKKQTSTLRHHIEELPARSYVMFEVLDSQLFSLFNEFWLSYYVNRSIYDKKFVFVPGSIVEDNLTYIPLLDRSGVLHD